ncbi:hypothetical protein [Allorhodopirellula heiligendammensis]|uniref:Uncharacterized protein n=1 Tax=Allorhodopirellula heiligendammensis TaxID=2714739 RepID=A0A5C6BY02_9BACT|nr:hypothetical protein [Allorhodopirellula heiligendammensis]TWU16778.1 hypothetical protein Poly21_39850 [Allorhodopirellula heiligendammensis]|tara:strand:+ start:1536 stop:1763 length:228 start_codon:yes stop_codon:yes gene_type:complete
MMTATATPSSTASTFVSPVADVAQNETQLSDIEILRRVRSIRSSWTVTERMERRQEAGERFARLIEALSLDHSAA